MAVINSHIQPLQKCEAGLSRDFIGSATGPAANGSWTFKSQAWPNLHLHHTSSTQASPLDSDAYSSGDGCSTDEYYASSDCLGYAIVRELFCGTVQKRVVSSEYPLNHPSCNRLARLVSRISMLLMNKAWSDMHVQVCRKAQPFANAAFH